MQKRGQNYFGLVIKDAKTRENDLLVTLLTKEKGKLLVVAKGACKLNSSKRATLEPGNLVQAQLLETKGWPILTQAKLVSNTGEIRENLKDLRRLFLFLEILDLLLTEEEVSPPLWQKIIYLRELLLKGLSVKLIRKEFGEILSELGYIDEKQTVGSISALVSQITGTRLRTYEYLRLEN